MSQENLYLLLFILLCSLAVILTRATPFLFLRQRADHPVVSYLGRYLPAGIIALLASIFLLSTAHWQAPVWGLDALLPAALVIAVHLWRRSTLLSILAGTLTYMAFQQGWFNQFF